MPSSYEINCTVFNDRNRNGTQDTGEAGLAGWALTLERWDGAAWELVDNTGETDANGQFSFGYEMGAASEQFQVTVTLESGYEGISDIAQTITLTDPGNTVGNLVFAVARTQGTVKECFYPGSSWVHKVCWVPNQGVQVTFKNKGVPYFTCVYPATIYGDYEIFLVMASKGRWIHQFYWGRVYFPRPLEV